MAGIRRRCVKWACRDSVLTVNKSNVMLCPIELSCPVCLSGPVQRKAPVVRRSVHQRNDLIHRRRRCPGFLRKMSHEQPSSGSLQAQMDPDSSRTPNPEPDLGELGQFLVGGRTVEPATGGVLRRSIPDIDRRCARPVDDQKAGGAGSSGSRNGRRRRSLH